VQLGEIDGFGDLAPNSRRAGRGRGDQPRVRAGPDLQERRHMRSTVGSGRECEADVGA